ncbi:MAG: hypothetical protein HC817_03415 [Saprospiraceae bacterium]|nr:hypothetical protein [Saprospiraceae bacterium]
MKKFLLFLAFGLLAVAVQAATPIKYKLVYNFATSRYEVYMNSATAFSTHPQRLISTAQVTLVVPTGGGFVVSGLTGGTGAGAGGSTTAMVWSDSRFNAPTENPTKDYIFFGYNASANSSISFSIPANQDILLFSFQNSGTCPTTAPYLIDNATDPFLPPNSASLNTPNAMTIFGNGLTNAYGGNLSGNASCQTVAPATVSTAIAPNPMTANQNGTLTLTATNSAGNPAQSGMGYSYTLPTGLSFPAGATVTNSCGGTATIVGNTVNFSGGSMASGTANCAVSIPVVAVSAGTIDPTTAVLNNLQNVNSAPNNGAGSNPISIIVNPAACAANAGVLSK